MSDRLPPHLAAVERRLERATLPTPAPNFRRRVLASIDDVLHEKVPATTSGQSAKAGRLASPDVVAGTVLAMSVVVLPLVAMAFGSARLDRSPPRMLSFVERARLAGITIEATPAREVGPTLPAPDRRPRAFDARALLERTLLQGDL